MSDSVAPAVSPGGRLRTRRRDLALVFLQVFLAECPRGAVMSTMLPYFSTLTPASPQANVAVAVSLFSLGRLLASVPFGYLVDRTNSSRTALIIATTITIAGQLLYALGQYAAPGTAMAVVLLSRLVIGFGTGTLAISRAFMAKICAPTERTQYIAYNTLVQYVGYSSSPVLPMLIGFGGDDAGMQTVWAPSLLVIMLNAAVLVALWMFMRRQDPAVLPPRSPSDTPGQLLDFRRWRRNETAFCLFLFLNLALRGVVGVAETIAAPEYQRLTTTLTNAIDESAQFLFALGAVGILTFASLRRLGTWTSSFVLLQVGMVAILIGSLIMDVVNDSMAAFVVGMVLVWSIGSPITQVLTISTYSQLMGERPQGAIMGWLTTAGSVGRILLPMACVGSVRLAHAVNIGAVLISIVSVAMFRMRNKSASSAEDRLTAEF